MYKPVLIIIGVIFSSTVTADICSEVEIQFQEAVKIYQAEDGTAFMKRVLSNDPPYIKALPQAGSLESVEQIMGPFISASILSTKTLGERTCYVIFILEYEIGPLFALANFYKGSKGIGAITMSIIFDLADMLPTEFLYNEI